MTRATLRVCLLLLSPVVFLTACSKSANQAASSDSASPTSSSPSGSSNSPKEASRLKPIVVPADTELQVVLDQAVGSKISHTGETFSATVAQPIEIDGRSAIPKGAQATGIVKDAKAAGRFKGGAVLELALTSINVNDRDYEIQTSASTMTRKGKGKRTAAMIGGGAAGGAAIGAVAGGGKGAGIGALIGAAAGTGGAGLTGNRDISVPAETALSFKLEQPLELKRK